MKEAPLERWQWCSLHDIEFPASAGCPKCKNEEDICPMCGTILKHVIGIDPETDNAFDGLQCSNNCPLGEYYR